MFHNRFLIINCQRGNRKRRGCLGGRFLIPRNVSKNSQILRNPIKFAFLTILGCKQDPIFGRWRHDLVFTTSGSKLGDHVYSCSFSVQEALTTEHALIRFSFKNKRAIKRALVRFINCVLSSSSSRNRVLRSNFCQNQLVLHNSTTLR